MEDPPVEPKHQDQAESGEVPTDEEEENVNQEPQKVPTRTGPCCTPSTISCHSYGLASHQVLHDLALSCTISHTK